MSAQNEHRLSQICRTKQWADTIVLLGLSARETQIIERLLIDSDESAVAATLKISRHTVHTHLERLYRKLNVSSRAQLIARVFVEYACATLACGTIWSSQDLVDRR